MSSSLYNDFEFFNTLIRFHGNKKNPHLDCDLFPDSNIGAGSEPF
jgi:hypothetical protein